MTKESAVKTVEKLLGEGELVGQVQSKSNPDNWYAQKKVRVGVWTCECLRWKWNAVRAFQKEEFNGAGNPKIFPCRHMRTFWKSWKEASPRINVIDPEAL